MKKLIVLLSASLLLFSCKNNNKEEVVPVLECQTQTEAVNSWLIGDWKVSPNTTGIDSLFFNKGQYTVEDCGKRVRIQSRVVSMEITSYQANSATIKLYYYGTVAYTVINRIR